MAKIYRQAVMAVIVDHHSKILIGYSPRDKSFKFPQGGLENDEDPISGIQRELLEELNYDLPESHVICLYEERVRYPFPPNCHPVFMGQELQIVKIKHNPETETIPQDDEFDQLHWIHPVELERFNSEYRSEAYQQALRICGLL